MLFFYLVLALAAAAFMMWPNHLPSKVVTTVIVNRPIETVFDYATTPAHWPQWRPESRAVSGAVDHSLRVGEEAEESFVLAGRPVSCVWKVTAREEPKLWTISMRNGDMGAEITYRLVAAGPATQFERTTDYWTSGIVLGLADLLVMRRLIRRDSDEALQRLKVRIEALPVSAASEAQA